MEVSRNRAVIGVLLVVFVCFIILMFFAFMTVKTLKMGQMFELDRTQGAIAVVEVNGVIMDSQNIIENLVRAEKSLEIKAIILRVNSPGGAVAPVQEIYEEILRIDAAKPVFASLSSVAASGGYYVAAATRKIYSNPGSLLGSIGVIMPHMDASELYKWAKLRPDPIKAGRYKDLGSGHRPIREEERDLLQTMLKDVHRQFIDDIYKKRQDKILVPVEEAAEGQIFSGSQALKMGLVDKLGGLWQAGREIHQELALSGEFGLRFIKKKEGMKWLKFFDNLNEATSRLRFWPGRVKSPMYIMEE